MCCRNTNRMQQYKFGSFETCSARYPLNSVGVEGVPNKIFFSDQCCQGSVFWLRSLGHCMRRNPLLTSDIKLQLWSACYMGSSRVLFDAFGLVEHPFSLLPWPEKHRCWGTSCWNHWSRSPYPNLRPGCETPRRKNTSKPKPWCGEVLRKTIRQYGQGTNGNPKTTNPWILPRKQRNHLQPLSLLDPSQGDLF